MPSDKTDGTYESIEKNGHFSIEMAVRLMTWLKLIGINLVAFGIDLCSSAGFTYVPPLLLKAGYTEQVMAIILGIGPFISLLLVPVIGQWSDVCESRMGRRSPFILFLSILMLISLAIIPYSAEINQLFSLDVTGSMFILALGIVILDFSSQALQNPCKALVSDILIASKEQDLGFTVYSCMLSLGGCIGYLVSSLDWGSTKMGYVLGSQEKVVFVSLAVVFTIFLVINLLLAQENVYHPVRQELPIVNKCDKPFLMNGNNNSICNEKVGSLKMNGLHFVKSETLNGTIVPSKKLGQYNGTNAYQNATLPAKRCFYCLWCLLSLKRLIYRTVSALRNIPSCLRICAGVTMHSVVLSWRRLRNFLSMPHHLFRLFIVSLITWMAIMCHDTFYTDFMGQVIYQGKPSGEGGGNTQELYDEGVRMGSWGLLLHCLAAAIYAAFFQDHIIKWLGQKEAYIFAMACYTLSMGGTIFSTSATVVNICSGIAGIGLGAATTIPYSLVTTYYTCQDVYYQDSKRQRGLGEDMAVLDAACFLSQIILSLIVGHIVKLTGTVEVYMVVACVCGALACYSALFITCPSRSPQ